MSKSLFAFTRHGFLWRVAYAAPTGTKWVRAWTKWGARRIAGTTQRGYIAYIERAT